MVAQKGLIGGFVIAIAFIIALAATTWLGAQRVISDDEWIAHTHEVLKDINRFESSVFEAESSVHAYVITGDPKFVEDFNTAATSISSNLESARHLTSNNPAQQQRLDRLAPTIEKKLAVMKDAIALRQRGDSTAATRLIQEQSQTIKVEIRQRIEEIKQAESQLLNARLASAETSVSRVLFALVTGHVLSIALLIFVFYILNRSLTTLRKTVELKSHLADLVESSNDAIIGATLDGTITSWNKSAERLYGYTASEIIGRSHAILVPPGQPDEIPQLHERIKRGEQIDNYETVRVRKDGQKISVSIVISSVKDENGNVISCSAITRDITERKLIEKERERFFTISLDMLCVADTDGYFIRLNPAWEKKLGFTIEELLSKPYLDFIHPDDRKRTLAEANKIAAGDVTIAFENRYRCKDGSYKWFLWNAILDHENQLIYAVARDITERKLVESEREALISELKDALTNVKVLRGLLPICSYCKSVRDDKNYWKRVEDYITEHSEALLTHGICPKCYEEIVKPQIKEAKRKQSGNNS